MIGAAFGALLVVPLWIAAPTSALIVLGGFLMQFFVQGAWGVIPAHMNELSPAHLRGFLPGFAYQIGMVCAGIAPVHRDGHGRALLLRAVDGHAERAALVVGMIVIGLGPEAHGIEFRKTAPQ